MFIQKKIKSFIALLLVMFVNISIAMCDSDDPIIMMKNLTDNVMVSLKKYQKQLEKNPNILYDIVDKDIVPCVDVDEMARWIAGRNAWQSASAASKESFIKEFKILLVSTYAKALKNYADKKTKFLPLRGEWQQKKRISVNSQVINNVGQVVSINYRLIQHSNHWKVYDIVVEGVSLLKGYQSQFTDKIKKEGLNAVIEIIAHHNKEST